MVKDGSDFVVHDAKSGENITRQVLTQIIFEEEAKGENLLPIDFLRQLIRFYGDSMQAFVPSYLQFSMDHLTREHERLREEMVGSAGTEMIKSMEDQARKNMAMFQDAMQLFNPFATMQNMPATNPETVEKPAKQPADAEPEDSSDTNLDELRDQIKSMQSQIEKLAGKD